DNIDAMRGFSGSLGVRCQHCHVGEEGQPLSEFDFASDVKETKRVARQMMRMTRAINATFLPGTGRGEKKLLEVSCFTCHRSVARPEPLDALVYRRSVESGVEAGIASYRELREEYHGRAAYDFGEASLARAARRLAGDGDAPAARSLLELNLEHHPESVRSLVSLGDLQAEADDLPAALGAFEKALELSPGSAWIENRIAEVKAKLAEAREP
ncbi:MAG: c-type cytochrome, partial [Holophagales bacterium]|nr:c-type cytochrome [Holophagales bacterium]